MAGHPKSEPKLRQYRFEMLGVVNRERCSVDVLFPFEFPKKQYGEFGGSDRKRYDVEELVRLGIDANSQRR